MARVKRSSIPWCILYSQKITANEFRVFCALKDRAYQVDKSCEKGFYCFLEWLSSNLNLSDKTIKKAIKGLREKKIISSMRIKINKNVVNLWTINWDIIDKVASKFKFVENNAEMNEEVDLLDDEPINEKEPIVEEIQTPVKIEVMEVKTPSVQVKETSTEEQSSETTECEDNKDDNKQIKEEGEEDMEKKSLSWLNSDEFYAMRIVGNINYWTMLFKTGQEEKLNEDINKWVNYDSVRFFNNEYKDEIKEKIWSYINNKMAS